jgi:hypothetical protein
MSQAISSCRTDWQSVLRRRIGNPSYRINRLTYSCMTQGQTWSKDPAPSLSLLVHPRLQRAGRADDTSKTGIEATRRHALQIGNRDHELVERLVVGSRGLRG